ncbi:MAG: ornithine carbamoyltransferase [Acidimicrobiales bacterium]
MTVDLRGRSFLKEIDFTKEEFGYLIDLAGQLRDDERYTEVRQLIGRNIALIFEKTSTRTRSAFEVAAHQQGANVTYLGPGESQIGHKESIKDTARVLGRMFDGIEYSGAAQENLEILARHAGVPVWNGLTDTWHPTQMLADMLTMRDHSKRPFNEIAYCYVGDARNNTANSLLVTGALLGTDVRLAAPEDLLPSAEIHGVAEALAATSGARLVLTSDIERAIAGVDFVYTDIWLSMGEPEELWGDRIKKLLPYQVNSALMEATGNPAVKFMHCLPALHNRQTEIGEAIFQRWHLDALEVSEEVFESEASIVFDQAENRLHAIKALLVSTVGN